MGFTKAMSSTFSPLTLTAPTWVVADVIIVRNRLRMINVVFVVRRPIINWGLFVVKAMIVMRPNNINM